MPRRSTFALGLLLAGPAFAAGTLDKIQKTGTVLVGYRESSPPFSYLADGKQPIGYTIDICGKVVEAIKKELKRPDLAVKYVPVSSSTRIPLLLSGDIDLECGMTTSTGERRKQVAFTIPTFIAAVRAMSHKSAKIPSVYELAGKTVVSTSDTSSVQIFKDYNTTHDLRATLTLGKDHAESFALLEAGKADAFLMDDVILYRLRATSKNADDYAITRQPLTVEPLAIMLRKDDAPFKKLVDAEVTRVITQGEIQGIYKKWFESPIPPDQVNLRMPMSYMLRDSFKVPTDWLPN